MVSRTADCLVSETAPPFSQATWTALASLNAASPLQASHAHQLQCFTLTSCPPALARQLPVLHTVTGVPSILGASLLLTHGV